MTSQLSAKTLDTIFRALGVTSLREVLSRDYQDITPEQDIDLKQVERYASRQRGSVRIARGLVYTAAELEERRRQDGLLVFP